jgi:hypothetical protein
MVFMFFCFPVIIFLGGGPVFVFGHMSRQLIYKVSFCVCFFLCFALFFKGLPLVYLPFLDQHIHEVSLLFFI